MKLALDADDACDGEAAPERHLGTFFGSSHHTENTPRLRLEPEKPGTG